VMFADIRGFTALSEELSPDEIASLLNEYFTEMVEIVFEHGGALDKFMGDAMMAIWGAPVVRPDDPAVLEKETGELSRQRTKSQPGGRNAGCVFKNPDGGQAGRIIDDLGLKNTRVGGAVISPRHANFVVNDAGAKAGDVLGLLDLVRERVQREAGVDLELEVKVWRPRA